MRVVNVLWGSQPAQLLSCSHPRSLILCCATVHNLLFLLPAVFSLYGPHAMSMCCAAVLLPVVVRMCCRSKHPRYHDALEEAGMICGVCLEGEVVCAHMAKPAVNIKVQTVSSQTQIV